VLLRTLTQPLPEYRERGKKVRAGGSVQVHAVWRAWYKLSVSSNENGVWSRFALAGRALKSRNYRLFFIGQLISLIGNWMTQIATSWLVYRLTGSSLMLGAVSFAGQFPAFLFAPVGGVLVDRWDLRKTLLATQILSMLQSLALAYFTLTHRINVPILLGLYVVQGFINGLDIPARQTIVSQLVDDPNDIGNVIALNSSVFNLTRVIGPAIAGFVIAASNEGVCFLIDGISYMAALVAMYFVVLLPREPREPKHVLTELNEGLTYTLGFPPLRTIILYIAVVSLLGIPYTVLMPVFAKDLLHGDSSTMGFLMGGIGVGAVVGALMLASRRTVVGLGRWMVIAGVGFSGSIALFAISRMVWLSVLALVITGWCLVTVNAAGNTLVQTIADDDKRGRALSLLVMCFLGMVPIGSLLFGEVARPDRLGPTVTVIGGATCVAAATIWFAAKLPEMRKHVRPILVRRGILPPIAAGLETQGQLATPPEQAG
jgi:MFS family permease